MKKWTVVNMAGIILASSLSVGLGSVKVSADVNETIDNAENFSVSQNQNESESSVISYEDENGILTGEVIYEDQNGNVFTNSEVITGNPNKISGPSIGVRSISASVISIGILWKYTTKADGTRLRNTFRKVAASDGTLGGIATLLAAAGIATGGLTAVLGAFTAGLGLGVNKRFNEAADEIVKHPNSGKIYMYIDHVTYRK